MFNIGLDYLRDWQWCLGVWILCGFVSVALNAALAGFAEGENPRFEGNMKAFIQGPIWLLSIVSTLIGMIFSAVVGGR